jgi:hypothetical protein
MTSGKSVSVVVGMAETRLTTETEMATRINLNREVSIALVIADDG